MTLKEYLDNVNRTRNKDLKFEESLCMISMGLSGEAGELTDLIKKIVFHYHAMDLDKIKKEMGDVLWYWSALCIVLNLDPEEILNLNVAKLKSRYPAGFSAENSINRKE